MYLPVHFIANASMKVDSGSGSQDTYTGSCLFNLDAKRSISGDL